MLNLLQQSQTEKPGMLQSMGLQSAEHFVLGNSISYWRQKDDSIIR